MREARDESALDHIAANMSNEDREELAAGSGLAPFDALSESVMASSESFIAYVDDEPVAAFGVAPNPQAHNVGIVWLLSTDKARTVPVRFIKESRRAIARWLTQYDVLHNIVDARNVRSQLWLTFLGFVPAKVHDPCGVAEIPFIEFMQIRSDARV